MKIQVLVFISETKFTLTLKKSSVLCLIVACTNTFTQLGFNSGFTYSNCQYVWPPEGMYKIFNLSRSIDDSTEMFIAS